MFSERAEDRHLLDTPPPSRDYDAVPSEDDSCPRPLKDLLLAHQPGKAIHSLFHQNRKSLSCPNLEHPPDIGNLSSSSSTQGSVIVAHRGMKRPSTESDNESLTFELLHMVRSRLMDRINSSGQYLIDDSDIEAVADLIRAAVHVGQVNHGPMSMRALSVTEKGVLVQPRASAEIGTTLEEIQSVSKKSAKLGEIPLQRPLGSPKSLPQKTLRDFARATRHGACHHEDGSHGRFGTFLHGWRVPWKGLTPDESPKVSAAYDEWPNDINISYPVLLAEHRLRRKSTPRSIFDEPAVGRMSHYGSAVGSSPERRKSSEETRIKRGYPMSVSFSPDPPTVNRDEPWVKYRKDSAYPGERQNSVSTVIKHCLY